MHNVSIEDNSHGIPKTKKNCFKMSVADFFYPACLVLICCLLLLSINTLLSNRPVGALVSIVRPVVNSVGLSMKMAPEGVLEFTCLEKESIYCNILF